MAATVIEIALNNNLFAYAKPLATLTEGAWTADIISSNPVGSLNIHQITVDDATDYVVFQRVGEQAASTDTPLTFVYAVTPIDLSDLATSLELAAATAVVRQDIGVLLGPQERRVTFTATNSSVGVSGVRITAVGTARTGFTNVNGLLPLNLPQSETPYIVRVSPPLGFDPVDDLSVTVADTDVSVPISLSLTPIGEPEDPSLIPVLVNLFTQFGEPCIAAKVVVEVIGDPAIASLAALTNVDNISHTGTNGQARINLYRGQQYRFTITYKRYAPIVLLRTLPTTGDSFVVTQVVS